MQPRRRHTLMSQGRHGRVGDITAVRQNVSRTRFTGNMARQTGVDLSVTGGDSSPLLPRLENRRATTT